MSKTAITLVRNAAGLTQSQFSALLGISRSHLAKIETGIKTFTPETQRKIAAITGAWIPIESGKPAPKPIPLLQHHGIVNSEEDHPYSSEHWEKHRNNLYSTRSLRFDGENDDLLIWLQILLAAGMRAEKYESVRIELTQALTSIAQSNDLEPTLDAILSSYEPTHPKTEISKFFNTCLKAKWEPHRRLPSWLRTAIDLNPLVLHVTPTGKPTDSWAKSLSKHYTKFRKKFITLLNKNPDRAIEYAKEENASNNIIQLAENVSSRIKAHKEHENK